MAAQWTVLQYYGPKFKYLIQLGAIKSMDKYGVFPSKALEENQVILISHDHL